MIDDIKTIQDSTIPAYMQIRQYVMSLIQCADRDSLKIKSVRELCKLYSVSHPTVMKALAELIDEGYLISRPGLGTFINIDALERQKQSFSYNYNIGIILNSGKLVHIGPSYMRILSPMFDVFSDNGACIEILSPNSRGKQFVRELLSFDLHALVWVSPLAKHEEEIKLLDESDLPLLTVSLSNELNSKCCIALNFFQAGYQSTNYLLDRGHQRLVYAVYNENDEYSRKFYSGLQKAYADKNLDYDERLILKHSDNIRERLEMMLDFDISFTGIICTSPYYLDIIQVLKERNISVPEQCSVITEKDMFTHNLKNPVPTCLAKPTREIGILTGEVIMDIVEGKRNGSIDIQMDWTIQEGETCRSFK